MKSLLTCVFWPAWLWGPANKPHIQWMFGSYSLQLAIRDNIKRRRLIESPWYKERWGERFQLAGDQNQKTRFENDRNGVCLLTSPDSAATGEGGDIIVIDDPHNVKEATSSAERNSVLDWFDQSISTRLNDPRRGVKIVIGQRVHSEDLCGHLIAKGGWKHLCLPARYEGKHPHPCTDDWRTEEDEMLWPERVGPRELDQLKRDLGSYGSAGQLQQRPAPAEGNLIRAEWIRWYCPAAGGNRAMGPVLGSGVRQVRDRGLFRGPGLGDYRSKRLPRGPGARAMGFSGATRPNPGAHASVSSSNAKAHRECRQRQSSDRYSHWTDSRVGSRHRRQGQGHPTPRRSTAFRGGKCLCPPGRLLGRRMGRRTHDFSRRAERRSGGRHFSGAFERAFKARLQPARQCGGIGIRNEEREGSYHYAAGTTGRDNSWPEVFRVPAARMEHSARERRGMIWNRAG